jgi:quercetin dioxygenase-like cupin family protein
MVIFVEANLHDPLTYTAPLRFAPVNPRGDSMPSQPTPVPPDDLSRKLTVARPDQDQSLPHLGLVGDTYTILVTGEETDGKYTLIDMHVPPGGGPPPHRHDFEEMFTVPDGEVLVTFRGETLVARAGETINVPANAPHAFTNAADTPSRLLCMCAPSGQEEFFTLVGQPVATRTQAPPAARRRRAGGLHRQVEGAHARVQDRAAPAARREIKNGRRQCHRLER